MTMTMQYRYIRNLFISFSKVKRAFSIAQPLFFGIDAIQMRMRKNLQFGHLSDVSSF